MNHASILLATSRKRTADTVSVVCVSEVSKILSWFPQILPISVWAGTGWKSVGLGSQFLKTFVCAFLQGRELRVMKQETYLLEVTQFICQRAHFNTSNSSCYL